MVFHIALGFVAIGTAFVGAWAIRSILQEYRKDRVPALLYHHFAPKGLHTDERRYHPVYFCYESSFDEQMRYIHEAGFRTITLDDFLAFQDGRSPLPSKPILITFDDGFLSNYLYAFPILKKYGIKATIFTTVDPHSPNFIKYREVDQPLKKEHLQEMSDYGISIQSHSMTHRYLSELPKDVIRWELEESKRYLEELLKKPIHYIAIPSGAYDRTVKRLVKATGYKAAFCMLKGTNNKDSDRFALRRLVIGRDYTIEDFRKSLEPATTFYLRLASSLQNALLFLLGPGGLDQLRDFLYRSSFARSMIPGQVRYFIPGLAVIGVLVLLLGSLIAVSYWNF